MVLNQILQEADFETEIYMQAFFWAQWGDEESRTWHREKQSWNGATSSEAHMTLQKCPKWGKGVSALDPHTHLSLYTEWPKRGWHNHGQGSSLGWGYFLQGQNSPQRGSGWGTMSTKQVCWSSLRINPPWIKDLLNLLVCLAIQIEPCSHSISWQRLEVSKPIL